MRDDSSAGSRREEPRDCLAVLGLGPGADPDEIRLAYRRLVRRYHPDVSRDPGTAARFALVTRAYKVLSARADASPPPAGPTAAYRKALEAGEDLFALGSMLSKDPDPAAREAAVRRLGLSGRAASYVFLRRAFYDEEPSVVLAALRAVALLGSAQAEGEVAALYSRAPRELRAEILGVAEATGERLFRSALRHGSRDEDPLLRMKAGRLLAEAARARP